MRNVPLRLWENSLFFVCTSGLTSNEALFSKVPTFKINFLSHSKYYEIIQKICGHEPPPLPIDFSPIPFLVEIRDRPRPAWPYKLPTSFPILQFWRQIYNFKSSQWVNLCNLKARPFYIWGYLFLISTTVKLFGAKDWPNCKSESKAFQRRREVGRGRIEMDWYRFL